MRSKVKSLLHLAWPYIAIALLPILSVAVLSHFLTQNYAEKILSERSSAIELAMDRVDRKISTIEDLAYMVVQSDIVTDYLYSGITNNGSSILDCRNLQDLLGGVSKNDSIAEAFFYDGQSNRIIAASTVLNDPATFFRYQYIYHDLSGEQAAQNLRQNSLCYGYSASQQVTCSGRPTQVIEFALPIPIRRSDSLHSQLIIALDTQHLFEDFSGILSDGGAFCVLSGDTVLYASSEAYESLQNAQLSQSLSPIPSSGGRMYGAQLPCNGGLWQVRFFCPNPIRSATDSAATALLPVVVLPVLVCIFLCVFFTVKNHREIVDLLALFKGDIPADSDPGETEYVDYRLVRSYADRAIQRSSAYRAKLLEIQKSQKTSVLQRLLHNAYPGETEKQAALDSVELPFSNARCAALCVQFDAAFSGSDPAAVQDLIVHLLQTNIGAEMEVVSTAATELVCILPADSALSPLVDEIISLLNVQIAYHYPVHLRIGVGEAAESIRGISASYDQARSIIRYSESSGKRIYYYTEADLSDGVIYYPPQTDDKISNYMIAGCADEVNAVIQDIYDKNFRENDKLLTPEAASVLKYRITSAVLTVAEKQELLPLEECTQFLKEKNTQKYFAGLESTVKIMVEKIADKKNSAQNVLAVQINAYIQEHYADCGLNIKQIAGHFHFHENYISNLYRREYGTNLSSAIEKLRIEAACRLLSGTDTRISDIAEAVGYSLDSSFRRAFKKLTGVSPAEYRRSHPQL